MNMQLAVVRRSELLHSSVLDCQTQERIGSVDELWLDVKTHQVVGLTCSLGLIGQNQRSFTWAQVKKIGTDRIMVSTHEGAKLEFSGAIDSLVGNEVLTDTGEKIGGMVGYQFDPKTGNVINYLFVFNDRRSLNYGVYQLPPTAIVCLEHSGVIATEAAIQNAKQCAKPQVPTITTNFVSA
ncbi:MAG: hypothetical protein F6K58_31290 [Symploca sp. SIO2E9]|nr:hypothetical protein [Symploca sp. SIO2E9]